MSQVRLLVGTRKGAFILTADGARKDWTVSGPHFAGVGDLSPEGFAGGSAEDLCVAELGVVWAGGAAVGRWRGDLGSGRQQVSVRRRGRTHQWYDGTPHPWEFKRVWHLEPSLT